MTDAQSWTFSAQGGADIVSPIAICGALSTLEKPQTQPYTQPVTCVHYSSVSVTNDLTKITQRRKVYSGLILSEGSVHHASKTWSNRAMYKLVVKKQRARRIQAPCWLCPSLPLLSAQTPGVEWLCPDSGWVFFHLLLLPGNAQADMPTAELLPTFSVTLNTAHLTIMSQSNHHLKFGWLIWVCSMQ